MMIVLLPVFMKYICEYNSIAYGNVPKAFVAHIVLSLYSHANV